MIRIDHLQKSFRSLRVIKDLTTTLPSGSVTAVIGPNGSGKTTLMKSIVGLVQPDSGLIEVDGTTTINNPSSRMHIGYMSQVARYRKTSPLRI
ncbi:MAG: ATP-binding cassette domain-containing protein [Ignavibacteria bacterium]|nr:ATP-binding cassette domain-containing protein [Ignavibacteria bacterium]